MGRIHHIVAIMMALAPISQAGVIWNSESRSVTNSVDFNNPPNVGSSTVSSTGAFEAFSAGGTAQQNSHFDDVGGIVHLVATGQVNPTANVGLTTRNYTFGSSLITATFTVSGVENYTFDQFTYPVGFGSDGAKLTGPGGATINLSTFPGNVLTGPLAPGAWTLSTSLVRNKGDNIGGSYNYDFSVPEPALAGPIGMLGLFVLKGRRRRC
jgi:hypothetical protein